jgi:sulfatase maturation enzyme AslB (radical SAM superfamily)
VRVQLSFDGVPQAQAQRGRSTFGILDRRLRTIRRRDRHFYREKLSINVTVTPAAVRHMADSVDYFLGMGVQEIALSPVMTEEPGWSSALALELERQFERIHRSSLDHFDRTGEVPVEFFRKRGGGGNGGHRAGDAMCRLTSCETLAVEPSGRTLPCLMFAAASAPRRESPLAARLGGLDLGDIRGAALEERFARLPETLRDLGIFTGRRAKHSSFRRCGDCPHLDACTVCPAAIVHLGGDGDPDRVPDFTCVFNAVALDWRGRFPPQPGLSEMLREWPAGGDPFAGEAPPGQRSSPLGEREGRFLEALRSRGIDPGQARAASPR